MDPHVDEFHPESSQAVMLLVEDPMLHSIAAPPFNPNDAIKVSRHKFARSRSVSGQSLLEPTNDDDSVGQFHLPPGILDCSDDDDVHKFDNKDDDDRESRFVLNDH